VEAPRLHGKSMASTTAPARQVCGETTSSLVGFMVEAPRFSVVNRTSL
jgi:hypothetical protein